ncbi:STAS domain-containing protein [Streptomyces sp. DT2A-34]|uniref:STAS domain-containing protein n=1 Tax=Streptomyces sp. DT2A-34 TaxID=3051182 RepID=UPI00265C3451|nr:STAS domain-containing protein [Streptomyces sp. DT2A-34]MDO0909754.1 STAS domain-containing protein [Streptomyces sp. DT2A-34]
MADEHAARPQARTVTISEADEQRAILTFSGVLDAHALRELEERLLDQRLRQAHSWVLEMSDLEQTDLACAYALLRAVTRAPQPAALTVRGARRNVQRTLRHAGVDVVATTEE